MSNMEKVEGSVEDDEYSVELLATELEEDENWEFIAHYVAEVTHPYDGEDVHLHNTIVAGPKKDDLTDHEDVLHHTTYGFWPCIEVDRYGATPFIETSNMRETDIPFTNTEELFDACKQRILDDPENQIEVLKTHNEETRARIEGDYEHPLIDFSNVREGDTFSVRLNTGEVFEELTVTDCLKDFVETGDEKTVLNFTLEGVDWEQVNDRIRSDLVSIHQTSEEGGEPLHRATLYGLEIDEGANRDAADPEGLENDTDMNFIEFGTVIDLIRHD